MVCDSDDVPVTFLAHQAPVLPIARRWPDRFDGLALMVGSAAPDLAYVTHGWYGPAGIPLWFNGHRLQNVVLLGAMASLLTVVFRRVVLPVAPLTVPDCGVFRLRDYRSLAAVRHRWWLSWGSAMVGILTHLALDSFSHSDGLAVQSVPGVLAASPFSVGGRAIHVYSLLQYGGSVVLAIYTLWCLARFGRERRFHDRSQPAASLPTRARVVFWGIVVLSGVVAVAYGSTRLDQRGPGRFRIENDSVAIVSVWWVVTVGVVLSCLVVSSAVVTVEGSQSGSPMVGER